MSVPSLVAALAALVLAFPTAPALATPSSAFTINGPTLCLILPFLPQCKYI